MRRRPRFVLSIAAASLACLACGLVVEPDDYFDPRGVTLLADSDETSAAPSLLTVTPRWIYYASGRALFAAPVDGREGPIKVRDFDGVVTSLAFDGVDTLFACDGIGPALSLVASNPGGKATPALGGIACSRVSASSSLAAFLTVIGGANGTVTADAGGLVSFVILDRRSGAQATPKTQLATNFDVDLVVSDTTIYGILAGEAVRYTLGETNGCRLAEVGTSSRPRVVVPAGPTGAPLLVRGRGDLIRMVDPGATCCTAQEGACTIASLARSVTPGPGDYAVGGGFVYFAEGSAVKRQALADLRNPTGVGVEEVASVREPDALIGSVGADDGHVYFVAGQRVLRAPLPAHP